LVCKICDSTKHDARSCPERRLTVVCKFCNQLGHDGRSCPVRRSNRDLLSSLAELSSSSGSGESSGTKSDSDDDKTVVRVDFFTVENSCNRSVQHCRTLVGGFTMSSVFFELICLFYQAAVCKCVEDLRVTHASAASPVTIASIRTVWTNVSRGGTLRVHPELTVYISAVIRGVHVSLNIVC
jgi:hypothetical protein